MKVWIAKNKNYRSPYYPPRNHPEYFSLLKDSYLCAVVIASEERVMTLIEQAITDTIELNCKKHSWVISEIGEADQHKEGVKALGYALEDNKQLIT